MSLRLETNMILRPQDLLSPLPDNDTVDTRLLAWQPSRDELAWERLGWFGNLGDAQRVAVRTSGPLFLLVCPTDRETGPTGDLALRLRQWMIPPGPMHELLRDRWTLAVQQIPGSPDSPADSREVGRVARNLADPRGRSQERIELRAAKGRLFETFVGLAWRDSDLLAALRRYGASNRGGSGFPRGQVWGAPAIPDGGLRLRVVSRFLDGTSGGWRPLSKSDDFRSTVHSRRWLALDALEALSMGPREGHAVPGETWTLDPRIGESLCRAIIPNAFGLSSGKAPVVSCRLDAEVTQIGRGCSVRLTGSFRMSLASARPGTPIECSGRWGGYGVFGADRLPRKLRLCTHEGQLNGLPFGAVAGEH